METEDKFDFSFKQEIGFWIGNFENYGWDKSFYEEFFPFSDLKGDVLDIGCASMPIKRYVSGLDQDIKFTLVDPILEDLSETKLWPFLEIYEKISSGFNEYDFEEIKFDGIVCLNSLDYFNNPYDFPAKASKVLKDNGVVFLYCDIRRQNYDNHASIDLEKIIKEIELYFDIVKRSDDTNPRHLGWSTITSSLRVILKKRNK